VALIFFLVVVPASSVVRRVRKETWRRCHLRRHLGDLHCQAEEGANGGDDECCVILSLRRAHKPRRRHHLNGDGRMRRGRRTEADALADNEVRDANEGFGKRVGQSAYKTKKKKDVHVGDWAPTKVQSELRSAKKKKLTPKKNELALSVTMKKKSSPEKIRQGTHKTAKDVLMTGRVWTPKQIVPATQQQKPSSQISVQPKVEKDLLKKSSVTFGGGHRRGIVRGARQGWSASMSRRIDDAAKEKNYNSINNGEEEEEERDDKSLNSVETALAAALLSEPLAREGEAAYVALDEKSCAALRFPCRFVSDHVCCKYRMPLGMVARARAMDGSADLR